VRVWIDLTNSPHVLVMRPLIEAMRDDGQRVEVTARDFAQTLELCERFGIEHAVIGRHRGGRVVSKAVGLASRSLALARWARGRGFDVAIGHGSNDVMVAGRLLGIPSATAFDYEWARVQHHVNCRLARAVVVPEAIPPERLEPYGAQGKLRRYPGLKEEYYLADFEPDEAVLGTLGLNRRRPLVVVRTPPEVSLYHRFENPLFTRVLERLRNEDAQTVVLPRTREQRDEIRRLGGFVVPERAVDAQSLIAFADLVVSAGGTMNREAVALGTPVYTTFEGRLGAVDEALLREGRLRRLEDPAQVEVEKRPESGGTQAHGRVRRDPRELVKLLLSATE
jgi:predicted glycosyltransferase